MTTFWWVRHGPTHAKSMVGWTDLAADLSDTDALSRLSDFLPDAPVVSSDLRRAKHTADAIQLGRTRLPDDPALREFNFGDWEMAPFRDDPVMRAFWEQPGDISAPNGESWNSVRQRVDGAVDHYRNLGEKNIIIVAHMGVIMGQLQRAKSQTAYEACGHRIDPLSVTQIVVSDPWRVPLINHKP